MLKLWRGCLTVFFKFIKNNKGQGLVEFALVCAFCVAVGLAAREAGLLDALSDSYNEQQTAFAPSDIQPYKSNVAGNISAGTNVSGGGGTNTGGESGNTGGQGEGTGGQSGNTGGQGGNTGGQGGNTGDQGGNTGDQGGNTPGIVPGGSGEGEVDPEEQGGESQNTGTLTSNIEETTANRIIAVYEKFKNDATHNQYNKPWGDYADTVEKLKKENIYIDTGLVNTLAGNTTAWKTDVNVASSLKAATGWQMSSDEQQIRNSIMTKYNAQYHEIDDYLVSNNKAESGNTYHIVNEFISRNSEYSSINNEQMQLIIQNENYSTVSSDDNKKKIYSAYWSIRKQSWS